MMAFLRHRFIICFLSSFLLLGFVLKANSVFGCKWSNLVCELEEKQPLEDDNGPKEDQSVRFTKKLWASSSPHQLYTKVLITSEAHQRIYLMSVITPPLIAILSEPPEQG